MVTSVIAYDKTPDIGATVEAICKERAALDSDALEVIPVTVTLFEECPTECDITVIEYD
jgi:orotidine-5'-phosphate decarboxylase